MHIFAHVLVGVGLFVVGTHWDCIGIWVPPPSSLPIPFLWS